jgi:hypothetical protein
MWSTIVDNDKRSDNGIRRSCCKRGTEEIMARGVQYLDMRKPLTRIQLKPSKCPLRIRSPMGEGALRGFRLSALMVAERTG